MLLLAFLVAGRGPAACSAAPIPRVDQSMPVHARCALLRSSNFLPAVAHELFALDEARWIEIGQPAAVSGDSVDLAVEASAPHRNAKKILAPDSEA